MNQICIYGLFLIIISKIYPDGLEYLTIISTEDFFCLGLIKG